MDLASQEKVMENSRYVFEEKKADKMICSCRSGNNVSRLLCQSLGFAYVAAEDKIDHRNGEHYTLEYYELAQWC